MFPRVPSDDTQPGVKLFSTGNSAESGGAWQAGRRLSRVPATPLMTDTPSQTDSPERSGDPSKGSARVVMVVEDDADIRETLTQILEEEGYSVTGAAHGAEALEHLQRGLRPGLILLDLMMPVMNGWQLREAMLDSDELRDLPVVVVTADGGAQRNPEALRVNGVLAKPIDLPTLLGALDRFFPDADSDSSR